jgi:tetratricopeptide (TPR) repeat protein
MANSWQMCFVLMPFGPDFEAVYRSAVKPALEVNGLRTLRRDELAGRSLSGSEIWEGLREADVVIADVTGQNPNVFYELGVTHAFGKPTVLIARTLRDVPFDLEHLRVVVYKTDARSLETLRHELSDALRRMIDSSFGQNTQVRANIFKTSQALTPDSVTMAVDRADKAMSEGDYIGAISLLQQIAVFQERLDDLGAFAKTSITLGSAYQATGRYDEALASLQRALDISKRSGEPEMQAAAASNLANVLRAPATLSELGGFTKRCWFSLTKSATRTLRALHSQI